MHVKHVIKAKEKLYIITSLKSDLVVKNVGYLSTAIPITCKTIVDI